MSNIRQRKPSAFRVVQELDAFPKVPDDYKETTASGGGVSIIVFITIVILVVSEILYYSSSDLKFEYNIDTMVEQQLKINVDITVAMKCEWIGADVLDLTGQKAQMFGKLEEESVVFELSDDQQQHFDMIRSLNDYFREEYHAMHKLLWKTGYMARHHMLPRRKQDDNTPKDGCRLHGSLTVNKVAGNFHITAGKSIPVYPRGHAHLAMMVKEGDYNFSHRVDHISFGEDTPGIIAPLDSELKIAPKNHHMYQYFVQVVPTRVQTTFSSLDTYQYAYTEHDRTIDHTAGSHGVSGIFFKYDISPMKVTVKEEYKPYWQFIVRLCGIVGGVFATSGMLHHLVGFLTDVVCCRFKLGRYGAHDGLGHATVNQVTPSMTPPANDLVGAANIPQNLDGAAQNPLLTGAS